MEQLAAFAAAFTVAYTLWRVMPIPASYWTNRLSESLEKDQEPASAWQSLLLALSGPVSRFAPAKFVQGIGVKLYWAQLKGAWAGWEPPTFLALCIVAGVGGFLVGLVGLEETTGALLAAGVGFYLPIMRLNSKSARAIKETRRQLPEIIQLLATEVAAGSSLEQALERAAQGTSTVSLWFRDVLRKGRGRALFTKEGVLGQQARACGIKGLLSLAVQLDALHRQRIGGKTLLSALAASGADEYLAYVDKQAESLPSRLVVPTAMFFFLPFVISILVPLVVPMLEMFGG